MFSLFSGFVLFDLHSQFLSVNTLPTTKLIESDHSEWLISHVQIAFHAIFMHDDVYCGPYI